MGPPPVDILDLLRAELEAIGRDIDRQCAEAFAAARRANTPEVALPSADAIRARFLAPSLVFVRSRLRAERPDPKTHDANKASGELEQNAEEIIERFLPSRSLQRLQPVTGTVHGVQTKRRRNKTCEPESPDLVEIEILRPLEPDEIQLVRILFPDEIANQILYDSPEAAQTPTIYDERHGIIERLLPIEYRHIFRSRLRWLAAQLRAALKAEIDALLVGYAETVTAPAMLPDSSRAPDTPTAACISAFQQKVFVDRLTQGFRVRKEDISLVAGYQGTSMLMKYQREDPGCSAPARKAFDAVLSMAPANFVSLLTAMRSRSSSTSST